MSITFDRPIDAKTLEAMLKLFGEPAAVDDRTALYDTLKPIIGRKVSALARTAKQPVTVSFHDEGDIKILSDGTRYRVTPQGWRKI